MERKVVEKSTARSVNLLIEFKSSIRIVMFKTGGCPGKMLGPDKLPPVSIKSVESELSRLCNVMVLRIRVDVLTTSLKVSVNIPRSRSSEKSVILG